MSVKLETERLILRSLRVDDIDSVMTFWGNEEVMKYCGGTSADKERIKKSINFYKNLEEKGRLSVLAVVLKESDTVIGACGYNPLEDDDEVELIYHYAKYYWGKGYATEAGKACVEFAKQDSRIKKVIASIHPEHLSSRKVLEKIGFNYIGTKWFEDTKQNEPYFEINLR